MARPWQHPRTGIFWLRKRAPADLVPIVNRREEKRTLGTRDPAEAKKRHAEALAELERRWEQLRAERQPKPELQETSLSEREAHRIAEWQTFWQTDLFDRLWQEAPVSGVDASTPSALGIEQGLIIRRLEGWCLDHADDTLYVRDLSVDETSRLKLAKAIAAAVQRAGSQSGASRLTTSSIRQRDFST
jgi:hypothetical protein